MLYLAVNQLSMVFCRIFLYLLILSLGTSSFAQSISLYRQFNGPFDYTAFGNTLNIAENGNNSPCEILTQSSAQLTLQPQQTVVAAYLYWAGSGPGDFDVLLNQQPIQAERTFHVTYQNNGIDYIYFSAFADVTTQIQNSGNGNYTLSELDLSPFIPMYCLPPGTGTNFGGWAIVVIYSDDSLPMNQVNVFDGFESVSRNNQTLDITLNNLMILETEGAKIGFLVWEGDRGIAVNETLRINGNILSNLPLNPPDNAFNGTNSFTGSDVLYNMDIDFYSISDYISRGDTSAHIQLTSSQDFVIVNNIVTVLNTALPDASITIDHVIGGTECGNRQLEVQYTVYNMESSAELPAGTPIAVYTGEVLAAQSFTHSDIPINGNESGSITFSVPEEVDVEFILKFSVDDIGDGTGIVNELNEDNNDDEKPVRLLAYPIINSIANLETCDVLGDEFFNLTEAVDIGPNDDLSFHLSEYDAENNLNPIGNPENFQNTENPQTLYVRVFNADCFLVRSFSVEVISCPLPDATVDFPESSACRGRMLQLPFTVYNLEATAPLPGNVSIAFYSNNNLLGVAHTTAEIPIGGHENGQAELTLPESLPNSFALTAVVDDDGTGRGAVEEWNEDNNTFSRTLAFEAIPPLPPLPDLLECNSGFEQAIFDLTQQEELIRNSAADEISFFKSEEDAILKTDPIEDPSAFRNDTNPQRIFVRLDNDICFATTSFLVETENCEPFIPQGFSPNGDGINDVFEITNLLNIYPDFELHVYTRNGNLIHTGHNADGFWDGVATEGLLFTGNIVPTGVYYYVLVLNVPKYPKPFIGWVYINY